MEVTVIGLAASGKSTLLAALSGQDAAEAHLVSVKVHDTRIDKLSALFKPKKTIYAEIRAREAAWPGSSESRRKSEMDRYLDQIKGAQLFIHVLRACETPTATESPDARRDLEKLDAEMIFADLVTAERLIERDRAGQMDQGFKHTLEKCRAWLEQEKPLSTCDLSDLELDSLAGLNLVTLIPQLLVLNLAEGAAPPELPEELCKGRLLVPVCLTVAAEVAGLSPEDQQAFAEEMGLGEPAARTIARAAYSQLKLISFFTVGEDEVRAWTVPADTPAQKAAGRIHSDLERGFIRAEIVPWDILLELGSLKACRDAGKLQLEGKTYPVQDGQIMHVRFNV